MKTVNRHIKFGVAIILFSLFATKSPSLYGQQKIDPTLEVRREFDGKLMEITKSKLPFQIADSISRFNLIFDYTVFNKPVRDLYEFSPLPSAQIEKRGRERHPVFQAQLATSFPLAPFANIYYQPNLPNGLNLLLFGEHSSYFGKIDDVQAPEHLNTGGVAFEYSWKRGEAGIDIKGTNRQASLHGFGDFAQTLIPESLSRRYMRDTLSRRFNNFEGGFFVRSANPSPRAFNYLLSADYMFTDDLSRFNGKKVQEDYFKIKADFGPSFGENHKFMVGIDLENSKSSLNPDFGRYSLTAHPRYIFTQRRWLLEAGVKINKWAEADEEGFDFYFNGKASIALIPSNLWFYAEADGGTIFRGYGLLLKENNYISQSIQLKNTEIPFTGQAGFKGQVMDRFSYHIYGGYTRYRDEIFFRISDDENWDGMVNIFHADYASLNKYSAGAEVSWRSDEFEAGAKAVYNHYSRPDSLPSYNHSPFEAGLHARYNWRGRVSAGAELIHKSSMPVIIRTGVIDLTGVPAMIETKPYTTLNIFANYSYNSKFSFYLKGNNLFNSQGLWLADYGYRGINITVGVIITL